jgi:hypothetical protein
MKKFLFILIAISSFGIMHAGAQTATCKVTNPTEPGATVVGSIVSTDDAGNVQLTFSSDESAKRVNITFTVYYSYPSGGGGNASGIAGVGPNQSVPASVNIGKGNRPGRLSISGARCE